MTCGGAGLPEAPVGSRGCRQRMGMWDSATTASTLAMPMEELGDTRALGPEATQLQQQLRVQPHKDSALCLAPGAGSTEHPQRQSSAWFPAHFPLLLSASQSEPRIQPPGTHLQPGITSDLRQF